MLLKNISKKDPRRFKKSFLQRKQHLTELRKWLSARADGDGFLDIIQFSKTVCDPKFVTTFFSLADIKEIGYLTQSGFFDKLNHWANKAKDVSLRKKHTNIFMFDGKYIFTGGGKQ